MSIRHAILGVLLPEPMHGYQIGAELTRCIGGGQFNSAQVYMGLRILSDRGFVVAEPPVPGTSRDRRPFRITAAGEQEFSSWLRRPPSPLRPVRDETLVKLALLGRHAPERIPRLLERLRRQHLRNLAGRQTNRRSASTIPELTLEFTAAAHRCRVEAELHWIDYCLQRLREAGIATAEELEIGTPQSLRGRAGR